MQGFLLRPLQQSLRHPQGAVFPFIDQQLPPLRLQNALRIGEIQRHRNRLHHILGAGEQHVSGGQILRFTGREGLPLHQQLDPADTGDLGSREGDAVVGHREVKPRQAAICGGKIQRCYPAGHRAAQKLRSLRQGRGEIHAPVLVQQQRHDLLYLLRGLFPLLLRPVHGLGVQHIAAGLVLRRRIEKAQLPFFLLTFRAARQQKRQYKQRADDPFSAHAVTSAWGKRTVNTVPPPTRGDTVISPLRRCTVSPTMLRPSPVPPI